MMSISDMKVQIIRKAGLNVTAWVVRGRLEADKYIDCCRIPLSDHGDSEEAALETAKPIAQELADAPCNQGLRFVICAVGW